ncbi:ABC transporter permease [soil metagenome]
MSFGRFVLRRLLQAVLTLLLATFVFHTALTLRPGDPVRALFGPARPAPAIYEAMRAQYHFDDPWYLQYLLYLGDLLRGDWGTTFPGAARNAVVQGPPVTAILKATIPVSLRILLAVLVVQTVVGLVVGTLTAHWRSGWMGAAVYAWVILLVATPVIVVAFVIQSVFGWELGWFPVAGLSGGWRGYVLPVVSLSAAATGYVTLMTRSQVNEMLHARFIHMARARAIPEARIVGVHALRVSLIPVVTFVAANFGQLLTGLVIVEGVYSLPGVGGTLLFAIQRRDPALLIGLLVFTTAVVLIANLIADVLYGVIDPRVTGVGAGDP